MSRSSLYKLAERRVLLLMDSWPGRARVHLLHRRPWVCFWIRPGSGALPSRWNYHAGQPMVCLNELRQNPMVWIGCMGEPGSPRNAIWSGPLKRVMPSLRSWELPPSVSCCHRHLGIG